MKVTVKNNIEITIGDKVFNLTKEEAIALRNALNEQVGNNFEIPYKPRDNDEIVKKLKEWKNEFDKHWTPPPSYPYTPPSIPTNPPWQPHQPFWCEIPHSTCADSNFYGGIGRSTD